jgi:hypothetical protein
MSIHISSVPIDFRTANANFSANSIILQAKWNTNTEKLMSMN